jgi:signal transduction histidine kinase
MKNPLSRLFAQYLSKDIELRAWNFNLLALNGIAASVLIAVTGLINGAGWINVGVCLLAAVFAYSLLRRAGRTGRYRLYSLITVILVFLVFFPILFFTAGGYHSGMPSFFIYAVIFTVFMLEGKTLYVFAALEVSLYTAICLVAFRYPMAVHFFESEPDLLMDVLVAFFVATVMICLAVIPQFHRYDAQQKELQRLDKLKTEFLGNISHELKTPLAVMSGHAQTAQARLAALPEDEDVRALAEKMTIIVSAADSLALMVEQVLNITKIDEGRMVWDFGTCRIGEIIRSAVRAHFPILNKHENELLIRDDPELPEIYADARALEQVVVNLIANAARYTNRGTITITAKRLEDGVADVRVVARKEGSGNEVKGAWKDGSGNEVDGVRMDGSGNEVADAWKDGSGNEVEGAHEGVKKNGSGNEVKGAILEGGNLIVTVEDTGTGISPERLPHIFERYNRPERPGETDTGTGLGLFVCKQIIEAHGGEIYAESKPGKGTKIGFTLPKQSAG